MTDLATAGRVLARAGLVDAFGHVSVRNGDTALMTPPVPLGGLEPGAGVALPLDELEELPAGIPKEAWIHHALYRHRPDVVAICRAQPPSALAAGVVSDRLPALHGQGAMAGAPVPVFDDARLIRDPARGEDLARFFGDGWAVVLRGNGAVTAGRTLGQAVARMVVLEALARVFLDAKAAGPVRPLADEEAASWHRASEELLERLWDHLASNSR